MTDTRPCTCAPDERPYPCQHQYALGLCRKAEIRSLRAEVKQLRQDEKDSIEYRAVLAAALDHAEAERDALAALLRKRCPECRGTGLRDSGGSQPWGEPILLPCDCDSIDAALAAGEKK